MEEIEPKDLTGDPVYDFLKTKTLPGYTVVGATITEPQSMDPKAPKKIIEITLKRETIEKRAFNYNRVKRDMEEEA